jgi:hypothetical protein
MSKKKILGAVAEAALKRGVKQSTLDSPFFGASYKPEMYSFLDRAAKDSARNVRINRNPLGEEIRLKDGSKRKLKPVENVFKKIAKEPNKKRQLDLFPPKKSSFDRHAKLYDNLSKENKSKMEELFKMIDIAGGRKGLYSKNILKAQIGRIIDQGVVRQGLPEDAVIDHIIKSQANPFLLGPMLKQRVTSNPTIARAIKQGLIKEGDRPEFSHVVPVSEDYTKALKSENVFYGSKEANRAAKANRQKAEKDYIEKLDKMIAEYDLMDKYGLAKGGLIKKGIKKLMDKAVDNTKFDPSRRKFLKQTGATAAAAAMPRAALKGASTLAKTATKELTRKAPPWIKSMVSILNELSGPNAMGRTLANGTRIRNYGLRKSDGRQEFEIINSDGYKVPLYMNKGKSGDLHIEFDIRDDFQNNQHIYIDKKTGTTEIVDENFYMTSPEDYAKDDPIIFDVTTPSQMQQLERQLGVMRGDVDNRMIDYASVPEDYDYAGMFESMVDSFSPSGNIFNTKKAAEQLKQKRAYENMTEEEFEAQFRGGTLHGFRDGGGVTIRQKPDRPPQPRFDFVRNISDREAMARMMMAEDDKNFEGGKAVGHVIYNRSINPGGRSRYGAYENMDSDIRAIISAPNQFTPFNDRNTRFFADYKGQDSDLYNKYLDYADQIIAGTAEDFTGGADFFLTPEAEKKFEGNLFGLEQQPKFAGEYGGHKFYKSFEKGGMATHDEMVAYIRKNPQEYAVGGIVKKLAPKVIGKLREFAPKIEGPKTPKQRFSVFDEAGLPIKDFTKFDDAMKFAKDEPSYTVGNTPKSPIEEFIEEDAAGAMFWPSREKLIDAPFETAKGSEWLAYLKRPFAKHNPVKDMELNDTQLSTHLSRNANNKLSKADVIKDFDEKLAPDIDVIVLGGGRRDSGKSLQNILRTDLQGFRPGPLRNTLGDLQLRVNPLAEAIGNNDKQGILKIVGQIEDSVQKNFGVPNAVTEGFPQKFPFELKEPLQEIAQISGVRLAGFKNYAREANYRGQQTLSGGSNYREFLFNYKQKPGSLRNTEPVYTYAHDFGLNTSQRAGGFVHMRTSDRTDAFGRRILHIEEIQSDMHQPINAAARRVKKYQADQAARGEPLSDTRAYQDDVRQSKYAPRGDMRKEVDNANEQQMMLIQAKIDDLLQLPQTQQTQTRIARLNRERAKIRRIIAEKRAVSESRDTSNVPQGPYSKTEDYNEFVMKYALKTAQEGGYDGISISSPQIKNLSTSQGSRDYMGNITAYGPIAQGAMKKVGKKSGAKFMKTVITDDSNRAFEVPTLIIKDNPAAQDIISKGLGAYKRGGLAVNG